MRPVPMAHWPPWKQTGPLTWPLPPPTQGVAERCRQPDTPPGADQYPGRMWCLRSEEMHPLVTR